MTGAPMPAGSDAVLPAESADTTDDARGDGPIAAISDVSPGKNIGRRGEDIVAGTTLLEAGRVLRPQDLGVMISIGIGHVPVVRQPRVRLVITGNELLPSGAKPKGFQITDANGPMLTALAERDGAILDFPGLVRDEPRHSRRSRRRARAKPKAQSQEPDIIIVSGGSSVGIEDHAPTLVATHGELAVHGIAMRRAVPRAWAGSDALIFLLPGNPCRRSAPTTSSPAARFARSAADRRLAVPPVRVTLARKISSPIGRLDYARVRLDPSTTLGAGASAEPLSSPAPRCSRQRRARTAS